MPAVLFFLFCLLGLLFLLVKEERTTGSVQITVSAPGLLHVTQIPVAAPAAGMDFNARVNCARNLAFHRPRALHRPVRTEVRARPGAA